VKQLRFETTDTQVFNNYVNEGILFGFLEP